jgi:hypothetical protein
MSLQNQKELSNPENHNSSNCNKSLIIKFNIVFMHVCLRSIGAFPLSEISLVYSISSLYEVIGNHTNLFGFLRHLLVVNEGSAVYSVLLAERSVL